MSFRLSEPGSIQEATSAILSPCAGSADSLGGMEQLQIISGSWFWRPSALTPALSFGPWPGLLPA